VTSPPYTKPSQKSKTNFRRQAIQEPIFSVANADFEGGYDGLGCGVRHFFGQIGPTQPYIRYKFITVSLLKFLCNGSFASETDPTAIWIQKRLKIPILLL
jgi:hypothetical protein